MIIYLLLSFYFLLENPSVLRSLDFTWLPFFAPGILVGLISFYLLHKHELTRKLIAWLLLIAPLFKPIQNQCTQLPGETWALLSFIGGYFCIFFYLEKKFTNNKLELILWESSSIKSAGLKHFFYEIFSDILIYLQLVLGLLIVLSFGLIQHLVSSHSLLLNPWIDGSINLLIAVFIIGLMEPLEVQTCE
ncbi:MAG: hypothetical protein VX619_08765 [bacterium]|nr:hypothetical protein [bacterium]